MQRNSETQEIDTYSFQLGMINCFVEMVACGVKRMAISPPLAPDEYERIKPASEKIVREFGMLSHLEESLLVTKLQSAEFTSGKYSILYFREKKTLSEYLALKDRKQILEAEDRYDEAASETVSRDFMRLLSYPDDVIEAKLSRETSSDPFVLSNAGEDS